MLLLMTVMLMFMKKKQIKYFKKPNKNDIGQFFEYHPQQPFFDIPFKSSKAFYRKDKSQRCWLSYDVFSQSLFCSVCLSFSSEDNVFTQGLKLWTHVYQRIDEHEKSKNHTLCTDAYLHHTNNKSIDYLLFSDQKHKVKEEVKNNRKILERVIEIVKLIGKRGLSYRATQYESSYSLQDPTLDHGNFLEILLLLKKYDVTLNEHIDKITKSAQEKAARHKSTKVKGRGSSLTFISKTTVNLIIDAISVLMKRSISSQIQEAKMFFVQLDTTQDVSVQDQCSVIIRYVNSKGVNEKLISITTMKESTGKSFYEMLQDVLNSNGLDVRNCIGNATDVAANMQGRFNGFSSWLSKSSPGQIHVWCYSHILNLVIIEATKSPLQAASLFVLLNDVAVFFKESYKRMNVWKKTIGEKDLRRLVTIGNTGWWSKEKALHHIFVDQGHLYVEMILALDTIQTLDSFTPEVRVKAKIIKGSFLEYQTILTAFIYVHIFEIVGPLSRYLQTKGMDLIKSQELVDGSLVQLKKLQRNMQNVKKRTDHFIELVNSKFEECDVDVLIEIKFPEVRSRCKKKMYDEKSSDTPILNAEKKFEVQVYNVILDNTISSMEKKFSSNKALYTDLSCLSPNNFEDIINNKLPSNALVELCKVLKNFDDLITIESLRNELLSFAENWKHLKKSLPEEYIINEDIHLDTDDDNNDGDVDNILNNTEKMISSKMCKSCTGCSVCCYNVLLKYNLYSNAYSYLALAYKYLLTLPCTQVTLVNYLF